MYACNAVLYSSTSNTFLEIFSAVCCPCPVGVIRGSGSLVTESTGPSAESGRVPHEKTAPGTATRSDVAAVVEGSRVVSANWKRQQSGSQRAKCDLSQTNMIHLGDLRLQAGHFSSQQSQAGETCQQWEKRLPQ